MTKAGGKSSRTILLAVKVAATALALWLIVRKVDFSHMGEHIARARTGWLLLCIAMQFAVACLNGVRWKLLVRAEDVGLRKYLYYVFVGYFLTAFLPSAALAEGVRTYAFGKRYGSVQRNFVAMLFGRAVGLFVAVIVAGAFAYFAWAEIRILPLWSGLRVDSSAVWLSLAGLGAAAAVAAAFFRTRVASVASDLLDHLRDGRRLGAVSAVSLLNQFVMIVSVYALFRSVDWELPLWQAAFVPVAVQLLLLLPVSFGGVGVREYLNLMFYSDLGGAPHSIVLAASLLAYVPMLALAATGGLWMLYRRRISARSGGDET